MLRDWDLSVRWAEELFEALRAVSVEAGKITRPPYEAGEQKAHDLVAQTARRLGMQVQTDCAGNLHMTLSCGRMQAKRWLTGSHLDAVPDGGNFDGAAGVIGGLMVAHALQHHQLRLDHDLTVIAFRAEEASSWFKGPHKSHFGSRALLGQLSAEEMTAAKSLTDQRSLLEKIQLAGFDSTQIASGRVHLNLNDALGFVELHIEQGPVLVEHQIPVGVVSSIRGTLRARNVSVLGAYAHSGAVPREYRQDALMAAVELVHRLESQWDAWLKAGRDVVCTVGKFSTETGVDSLTKVPGRVDFTIDLRSQDIALLEEADIFLRRCGDEISLQRSVRVHLGELDRVSPSLMNAEFQKKLHEVAQGLGIAVETIASGAGHDAANFAAVGVPTAMIFIRNDHGSHNRDEAMDIQDFGAGVKLLAGFFLDRPNSASEMNRTRFVT